MYNPQIVYSEKEEVTVVPGVILNKLIPFMEENGKKFDFLVKPRAIVMGRNIERNLDFRDRVREYSSKSGIRLLKAQDIKK